MSDDIEVAEDQDVVSWTHSDYAKRTWKGFRFDVEIIDGKKYLDTKEITRTSPPNHEDGLTYQMTKHGAMEKYGTEEPPFPISFSTTVSKKHNIVHDLIKKQPNLDPPINENVSEENLFSQVVLAFSNLWNQQPLPSTRAFADMTGSSWNTVKQYLHVARVAGLFSFETRGKRQREPPAPTKTEAEAIKKFDDFLENKYVQDWIDGYETAKQKGNQKSLWKALTILAVSPDELLNMKVYQKNVYDNPATVRRLEKFLDEPRYRDTRTPNNAFPKRYMENRKGKDGKSYEWQLPKKLMTGDIHTEGAWYWYDNFGLRGKPKVWYFTSKKATGKKFINKLWTLKEWSRSMDAPDLEGGVQQVKWKANKKDHSAMVWKGTPREISEGSLARGQNNTFYNFVGVLRQFLETHGVAFGKVPEDSDWSQIVNVPRSAEIHLKVQQIEKMFEILDKGRKTGEIEVTDYHTYQLPKDKPEKFASIEEAKSYWHDAYFYFLLSLELGFRSQEAFTIIARKLTKVDAETDKSAKSGVFYFENGDIKVQIYTRKTERGVKGQKIHGGFIVTPETKKLIRERVDQVEAGMASSLKPKELKEKYGVVKSFNDRPYEENSLIGVSGRYTTLGTMDKPATLTKLDREMGDLVTVKAVTGNRDKLMAIFRNCYHEAGCEDDYWYNHTLHSLRHVFAQYWLDLSDFNYSFVAELGHWKTERMVKDVYGKPLSSRVIQRMRDYATIDGKLDPMAKLRKRAEEEAKQPSQEEKQAIAELGGETESTLKRQDLKLRESIFYNGGKYYDVSLPEDKRTYIEYPKGENIGYPVASKGKDKILYKAETIIDADTDEELNEGK